ncbi:hypothetical protein [Paracoccus aestuariivivens]|uniref:DUF4405 domain-containing protein n=1 Tax=Paracoccus aestuariivivens TaxID=1820333 RepID=A0A6L6J4E3_9RHOB|nr:hypothetical protein [Paracoccus aestuariivivens]MTH76952.1 hypothetical protein [Paracoccus aestuariivivens]
MRSALQSCGLAGLFTSGLYIWLSPESGVVLWVHIIVGLMMIAALLPWLMRHVPSGLAHSRRRSFTVISWMLLAVMLLVLATGLAMSVPALLWQAGTLWFPPGEITAMLSFLHFWGAWTVPSGLILHLAMRHWARSRK